MQLPKKYIHDRVILLLLSVNTFLTLLGAVLVLLRLDGARTSGYIAEYRVNLGVSPFKPGDLMDLLAFIAAGLLIWVVHTVLSIRMFGHHRSYSLAILSMGTLLLVLNIIVGNALLVLR